MPSPVVHLSDEGIDTIQTEKEERRGGYHFQTTLPPPHKSAKSTSPRLKMPSLFSPLSKLGSNASSSEPNSRDNSPDRVNPQSSTPRSQSAWKRPLDAGSRLAPTQSEEQSTPTREPGDESTGVNGSGTSVGGRRSVQFLRDTYDPDQSDNELEANADRPEASRTQSLYSKLRALTTPQAFSHTRSGSALSVSVPSNDGKDVDGYFSPIAGKHEGGLAAMMEEEDSEADADAEESAAEGFGYQSMPRKRRRKQKHFGEFETAPSSPHSPVRSEFHSHHLSDNERPTALSRAATDTGRQGVSEDEGRKRIDSSWTPRHPLRGLSYGGQRKVSDGLSDQREGRRQFFVNTTMPRQENQPQGSDAQTPQTPRPSRRKMMTQRGTTLSAAKWKQLKTGLRMLGQRPKKEKTADQVKSAELLAELAAGTPAALMLASMFQRDEHGSKRVPVLLEQLKVQITDSEVDKYKDPANATPGDRHIIFRIELEYGNGINRMKWVVRRSLRDFANLHIKYKLHYSSEKLKGRGDFNKELPKFPKSAFPYLKSIRGLEDEGEDEDDIPNDAEGDLTDMERPGPKIKNRPSFSIGRRASSMAIFDNASSGPKRDARYAERQRKKLELYLQRMIKFMLFRADANRLCKFLEISALGMRLAAEGSYHGKEGLMLIRSAKGFDFRKTLTPANVKARHTPKWFLVRHSYVVCVDSPEEMHIYDVFLFDSDFRIQSSKQRTNDRTRAKELANNARESAKHPQHHRMKLANSERKLKLLARNERQLHQFEESIRACIATSPWARRNRFDSFAPVRPKCFAQWLVDGRDHMWVLSRALNQAKDVIYIHDWWLSPELYLRRPPAISQKWRLDRLLKRKAEQGVKIFVIVYRNIESAIPIDSQYTKFSLLDLHPNVFVQRSPNQFRQNTFFWAHHEKLCIVDHTIAFVGGIDLCFGRWDTPQHPVVDDKPTGFEASELPKDTDHCQLWPGKDYSNPRIQDFYALNKPYEEMYDRQLVARMPWHDISMQVVGQPARDLTRHFVQRWNYILRQRKPTRPTPFLLPPPDFNAADLEALGLDGTCEVQMLRSAGPWSIGTPDKTEHSIMNAYVKMIEESDHFVYMENQFFISSCETESATVQNKIGDALVERIIRAHKSGEAWRACIVIPLVPGFQNTVEQEGGTSVRLIMQYQYRSICRGESSIFGRLRNNGIEPEDFIQFYSLRSWGKIGPRKALVTEQLYIHAKCMIVDDRVAIIGSANINERSMLGNRDSECAAIVRDADMIWSSMNGKPYQVGRFAHTLRMRLMREHLGLDVDKIMEDAQILEAEHRKVQQARPASAHLNSPDGPLNSPSSQANNFDPLENQGHELRRDLLDRNEQLSSFNHDVDWEQAENPNLKANRKLTEDPRIMGNPVHRHDVEGEGKDKMKQVEEAGYGIGRDTTLAGTKEVIYADLDPEGRTSIRHPRLHGETVRLPSYVVKNETPNPPMPPRPPMDRMSTAKLGLPMLSQLPALPDLDDSDIGGPGMKSVDTNSPDHLHPLLHELSIPMVDRDCMRDPIHDAFMYDTWHTVAENNTKIFRAVFRCMPDNQVRDWHEYHQYLAYEQRFEQMQGNDIPDDEKVLHPTRSASENKSGPPGVGMTGATAHIKAVAKVPSDLEKMTSDLKDTVKSAFGQKTDAEKADVEKEQLRQWATEANRTQAEKQDHGVKGQETSPRLDEKAALQSVPEEADGSSTERATSSPSTTLAEKTPPPPQFVGYSEALNMNAQPTQSKRRRRATTRGSKREFNASDDMVSVTEAEDLLNRVQGHLIVWPYDW